MSCASDIRTADRHNGPLHGEGQAASFRRPPGGWERSDLRRVRQAGAVLIESSIRTTVAERSTVS
jgi:hypothetical protein